MILKILKYVSVIVSMSTAVAAQSNQYKGLEIPPYDVVEQDGAFELRSYQSHIIAEVTVTGNRREAANRGFRVLANYIFGGNVENQKISMTAPVVQTPIADDGVWTIRFMMPSKFNLETLPEAETDSIRFYKAERKQQIVFTFAGLSTDGRLEAAKTKLETYAEIKGIKHSTTPIFQFYDDPFTNPFNRRNEVAFVIN